MSVNAAAPVVGVLTEHDLQHTVLKKAYINFRNELS